MLCCGSQFFGGTGLAYERGCLAVLIQRVVAMLAEIFMVRLEAKGRRVEEVLPSSTSSFIPFSPRSHFVFKETDAKGGETSDKDGPVTEVR
jgi:hypothetical protein